MIFSRFFTPDHAKPDPAIRKAAVAQLSPQEEKSRNILYQLAFSDESPEVNIAALDKLDSFELWQKSAQTSKNERVRKTAKNRVREAVLQGDKISERDKKAFLLSSTDSDFIADILMQDDSILVDTDLVLALLAKSNRPQIRDSFFVSRATSAIQDALLAEEVQINTLLKWQKKVPQEQCSAIEQRILLLEQQAQKPLELCRETTLVLSKLQALADENDYAAFVQKRETLDADYAACESEFACLKARDAEGFAAKKEAITSKLERIVEPLKQAHEQAEAEQLRIALCNQFEAKLADAVSQSGKLLDKLKDVTIEELGVVQGMIQKTTEEINHARQTIGVEQAEPLIQSLASLGLQLTRLPEWQRHTEEMNALLVAFEQHQLTDGETAEQISQTLASFQTQFDELFDSESPLAKSHLQRWRKVKEGLLSQKRAYIKQLQNETAELRKQMGIIGSLLGKGKFRAAMARFAKFQLQWEVCSDAVKRSIAKRYQDIAEQIARLEGWQDYVSAPRKPALLAQAQELVADTMLSMPERAKAIKLLRQQWQSLSLTKSNDDEQSEDASAFDQTLEAAFAPCRAYFSEMDEKRKRAIEAREALLVKISELISNTEQALLERYAAFDSIQQQWRAADNLPPADYQPLKQQYDKVRTEALAVFKNWLADNADSKYKLIKRAQKLLEQEDIQQAADEAKNLQQQWRDVATAGHRQDGQLWRLFREANDAVFARLSEQRKAQRNAQDEQAASLKADIQALSSVVNSNVGGEIGDFDSQYEPLLTALEPLPKPLRTPLQRELEAVKRSYLQQQAANAKAARTSKIKAFESVLAQSQSTDEMQQHESWSMLEKNWQQALLTAQPKTDKTRVETLLLLEVALGQESPSDFSAQRQQLQIELLTSGLGQGATENAPQYAEQWLSFGALTEAEQAMLPRVVNCLRLM